MIDMILFFTVLHLDPSALVADVQVIAFSNFFFVAVVEIVFFCCQLDRIDLADVHQLDLFVYIDFIFRILYLNLVSPFLHLLTILKRLIRVRSVGENARGRRINLIFI